jgi:hypothetical protein
MDLISHSSPFEKYRENVKSHPLINRAKGLNGGVLMPLLALLLFIGFLRTQM